MKRNLFFSGCIITLITFISSCTKNEFDPRAVDPPDSTYVYLQYHQHDNESYCLSPYQYLYISASEIDSVLNNTMYTWLPGGQTNNIIEIYQPGFYQLIYQGERDSLTISDTIVITETDTISFLIDSCQPAEFPNIPTVYIPNAFSPDQNGLNDYFRPISNSLVAEVFLQIRDMDGIILYEETTHDDGYLGGWNGKYNNYDMHTGVYLYYVEYKTLTTENNVLTGALELLR